MSMPFLFSLLTVTAMSYSCQESASTSLLKTDTLVIARIKKQEPIRDTVIQPKIAAAKATYKDLEYSGSEILRAAPGTKSVLFNSSGSRLYAMNLEGMSVYEFDQSTRKIRREWKFK